MVSLKKQIALSIARFILDEVRPDSQESPAQMYMRWKEKTKVTLHHPENARYALSKFVELGHMNEKEREAFAVAVKFEQQYMAREM